MEERHGDLALLSMHSDLHKQELHHSAGPGSLQMEQGRILAEEAHMQNQGLWDEPACTVPALDHGSAAAGGQAGRP